MQSSLDSVHYGRTPKLRAAGVPVACGSGSPQVWQTSAKFRTSTQRSRRPIYKLGVIFRVDFNSSSEVSLLVEIYLLTMRQSMS